MREAVARPQWRRLLKMEDDIYGELRVELFSTLIFDGLARAMGVEAASGAECEEDDTRGCDVNVAIQRFCLPEH
ncbi:unnamed protein product [Linum trigynum]|uniref:Uncharacterized protein n=1 Tax=Linum trigynum TaxID=586398 RepID=A0AAV2GN36_9ROSI